MLYEHQGLKSLWEEQWDQVYQGQNKGTNRFSVQSFSPLLYVSVVEIL